MTPAEEALERLHRFTFVAREPGTTYAYRSDAADADAALIRAALAEAARLRAELADAIIAREHAIADRQEPMTRALVAAAGEVRERSEGADAVEALRAWGEAELALGLAVKGSGHKWTQAYRRAADAHGSVIALADRLAKEPR